MSGQHDDIVDLTQEEDEEDEEDEDLKLAIALSLQETQGEAPIVTQPTTTNENGGLLGLDRKAMEAARLARLKRKREDEGSESNKVEVNAEVKAIPPKAVVQKDPAKQPSCSTSQIRPADQTSKQQQQQLYYKGIVLKTYVVGYSSDRTISFADLIAPAARLKSCLLSSFIWDFDWLFPHFNTKGTNFLLVMQAKYPRDRQLIEGDFARIGNMRLCFPPMEGQVNCMHSKLMLLFWEDRCRIVVPTANLTGADWGEGRIMENMVWLMDLARLPEASMQAASTSAVKDTGFKTSLKAFLSAQTVPGEVLSKLDQFDFSQTKRVGFIHSIGGSHTGNEARQTGHCGLGACVSEMGLADEGPIEVDFVTSSLGNLNDGFMRAMYLALQGDDGRTELMLRSAKGQTQPRSKRSGQEWRERFRFYFPSWDVVKASNGGPSSAGTICFSEKWWQAETFPKAGMRDCVSVRAGMLMHNKIILVRYCNPKQIADGTCTGYAYIGSANLSESAWGKLVKSTTPQEHKQNVRNWEAGIILPLDDRSGDVGACKEDGERLPDLLPGPVCEQIPIPMEFPARRYESANLRPWFFGSP